MEIILDLSGGPAVFTGVLNKRCMQNQCWSDHVVSLELQNRGPDAKTGQHRCFRRKTTSLMPSFYPTETHLRILIFTTVKFKEISYANVDK